MPYGKQLVGDVQALARDATLEVGVSLEADGVVGLDDKGVAVDDLKVAKDEQVTAQDLQQAEAVRRAQLEVVINEAAKWAGTLRSLEPSRTSRIP